MLFRFLADRFLTHRRALTLTLVFVTIVSLYGVTQVKHDDLPRTLFRSDDADFKLLEEVSKQFGADDVDCVLLIEADDLFRPAEVVALQQLIDSAKQIPGIGAVHSLADVQAFPQRRVPRLFSTLSQVVPTQSFSLLPTSDEEGRPPTAIACEAARQAALAHPMIRGQLLSDDARMTLVVAKLAAEEAPIESVAPIIEQLRAAARQTAAQSSLRIRMTGLAPIRTEIMQSVIRESSRFLWFGGLLGGAMALWMFRRPAAVIIVCGTALLGAIWTLGLMGLMGEKMNAITTVLPTLILVIGFTDAVHLMVDIRRERAAGVPPLKAATDALRHLGLACTLCAVTTAVGFGSLALARIEAIQKFGIICGVGAIVALIAVLIAVPLFSSTRWGLRLNSHAESDVPERLARWCEPLICRIIDYPWPVALGGILITGLLTTTMFRLAPNNQATEALPATSEAIAAVADMDRQFGGTSTTQVLVEWDEPLTFDSPELLAAMDQAQRLCQEHPEVHNPTSLINLIQAVPGEGRSLADRAAWLRWVPDATLHYYVRPDLRRALIRLRTHEVGSQRLNEIYTDVSSQLATLQRQHPHVRFLLTGSSVIGARSIDQMITDLAASLGSAAIIIFVVMAVGFRSLKLGLISIVPNLFPMAVTAAFLVFTGRPLQMTSVIVFSICLGIAVDDTIHFINRFQREMAYEGCVRSAILRTYHAVGSAMIMTSLVLLVGFGSLQISEMPTTRLFSALSCLTIFAALLGDLIILPAMLAAFMHDRHTIAAPPPSEMPQHREPVTPQLT